MTEAERIAANITHRIQFIHDALDSDKNRKLHSNYKFKSTYSRTEIKNTLMYFSIAELQGICEGLSIEYEPKEKIGALKDRIAYWYIDQSNIV